MRKLLLFLLFISSFMFIGLNSIYAQPQISVNPSEVNELLLYMQQDTALITITNNGNSQLKWNATVNFNEKSDYSEAYLASNNTIYKFFLNNPANITSTGYSAPGYICSLCYNNGLFYYLTTNTSGDKTFGYFDPVADTFMTIKSNMSCGSIALNPINGNIFGCLTFSNNNKVYSINPATGAETLVVTSNNHDMMLNMTFDTNGNCYFLDVEGKIENINLQNGNTQTITTIPEFYSGWGVYDAFSCDFETNTIYCTYMDPSTNKSKLYSYNINSQIINYVGMFPLINNSLATTNSTRWLNVEPVLGTIEAGQSSTIMMRLNGGWSEQGIFNATCTIGNNANTTVEIPVTMSILNSSCDPVINPTLEVVNNDSVRFLWSAPSNITNLLSYGIYFQDNNTPIATVQPNDTSYTFAKTDDNCYYIKAMYNNGCISNDNVLLCTADYMAGDANMDGNINAADIQAIIAYMCNLNPQSFDFGQADVNTDCIINILDVMKIVNIIMK